MSTKGFLNPFEIVAIGSSAGGIESLTLLLSKLPPEFPVPILIVQHRRATTDEEILPRILNRRCALQVKNAAHGEIISSGNVYLAKPGYHMQVTSQNQLNLQPGKRICFSLPSINPLFYSVAKNFGNKAIGVILSGANSDGANGVVALKSNGGRILVQTPTSCGASIMPQSAINTGCVDFAFSVEGIADTLIALLMNQGAIYHFPSANIAEFA